MDEYSFVIVGSGFGGAVAACRLAEAGHSVLVLERGRHWDETTYPSVTNDNWVFDVDEPERQNGWLDLRWFRDMAVVQGAGVGGGSLVYASVSVPPPSASFDEGWPAQINADTLQPYVDRAGRILEVATIPEPQRTKRWELVRQGAERLGQSSRFRSLPLAVQFDPGYNPEALEDPHDERHAVPVTNLAGVEQNTCIHLGECDLRCRVRAKNTLDFNYLKRAQSADAEIRALHLVKRVERSRGGWRVHYDEIVNGRRRSDSVLANRVVLAAGSLGSTEIMLRSHLSGVSARLGHGWSANGDFLTPAITDKEVSPTVGPTISACIDHTDGEVYDEHIFIQDGGLPNLLRVATRAWSNRLPGRWRKRVQHLMNWGADTDPLDSIMPWFAQGIDASDGRLRLRRRVLGLFGRSRLHLDWDVKRSVPTIQAIITAHEELARVTNGKPIVSPMWTLLRDLITPHPLGGCNMADDQTSGVVDHVGRVFGTSGLYIVDGSIVPRAIGRNPSRTIAALAERAVERWLASELREVG